MKNIHGIPHHFNNEDVKRMVEEGFFTLEDAEPFTKEDIEELKAAGTHVFVLFETPTLI
ncbi:hypothetical protein ACFPU1_16805 [Thalassorhabdus alkalitolerans]|uniref:Uncharacterized protein n=1 Tax=Thalassorhabdus alkalitolerans TaxID=2282697 RepID=A0ABW0YPH7_9BACI